jgi:hypothetical protein
MTGGSIYVSADSAQTGSVSFGGRAARNTGRENDLTDALIRIWLPKNRRNNGSLSASATATPRRSVPRRTARSATTRFRSPILPTPTAARLTSPSPVSSATTARTRSARAPSRCSPGWRRRRCLPPCPTRLCRRQRETPGSTRATTAPCSTHRCTPWLRHGSGLDVCGRGVVDQSAVHGRRPTRIQRHSSRRHHRGASGHSASARCASGSQHR